jgi:hypothetical protein
MKKYIMPLLALALLASCEKTIDFNGKVPDPKLIVGGIIEVGAKDDKHVIQVTESVFLYGGQKPQPVTDATFRIWRNGVEVPEDIETWDDGSTHRHFHLPVVAGDRLELEGETPKHGKVRAADVVPTAPDFRDLKSEWFQQDGKWYLNTPVTIADPVGEKNYYRIMITSQTDYTMTYWTGWGDYGRWETVENQWFQEYGSGYTEREIVFNNFGGDPIGGSTSWGQISDELIDGKEYTLDIYIQLDRELPWKSDAYFDPDDSDNNSGRYYKITGQRVTVEVQTLSENLFKYLRSAEVMDNEHNFSEPTKLFTNVEGGYGIFGAYNIASKTVELPLLEITE